MLRDETEDLDAGEVGVVELDVVARVGDGDELAGEPRGTTVVFTDIVGSTSLAAGLAVHLAARIMAVAADDEIWCRRWSSGSGHRFEPRGTHTLGGIPDEWALAAIATTTSH